MNKILNDIIAYENGELKAEQTIKLFSELVKTGQAWTLQGMYGRMASRLIESGYLDSKGRILKTKEN